MKTLFISNEEGDWEHFRKYLNAYFPDINMVCTNSANDAMDIVSSDGPFGFFIIDCHLPDTDVNALGLNLMDFAGVRPIIFIGHQGVIDSTVSQELFQTNEYNEKIAKPFERDGFFDEFKEKISGALQWAKDEEYEQAVEEIDPDLFIGMKIQSFYLYNSFPYDIYLGITSKSYVKLISADKTYSHSSLSKYAKKNVKFLYIKKDDQLKYLESESAKCLKSMQTINYQSNDAYLLQLRAITIAHQYMLALGVNQTVLKLVDATIDSIINMMKVRTTLEEIFSSYPNFYEGISSKSLLTAYISLGVAKKISWDSETTKRKLAVCSILMDLAVPEESLCKINTLKELDRKSLKEKLNHDFKNHPLEAGKFAKQFVIYPDIDFIIESHHEIPGKRGFPNQPSNSKLTQINAVFNSAQYVAAAIDGEDISTNLIAKTLKSMAKNYDLAIFKETQKILKSILKAT